MALRTNTNGYFMSKKQNIDKVNTTIVAKDFFIEVANLIKSSG
jgi:hypothetical protein